MTTTLDAANKRPTLEQLLKAAPMLARATRTLEPLLLAQGDGAPTTTVTVHSPALTDGKRVLLTAALRDELLRKIDAGELGYCELDVPLLAYEQRSGEDNRNYVCFRDASMRAIGKTGAGKPFLRDHSQRDSLARGGTLVESATEVPTEGHYEIRQVARLTAPWAIELYLRGNMTTVSIGWIPTGPVLCSVCDAPWPEKCGGWWKHWPGDRLKESVDDDGNKIYVDSNKGSIVVRWIYTSAELIETSCVPVPGVPTAEMDQLRATLSAQFSIEHEASDPPRSLENDGERALLAHRARGKSTPSLAAPTVGSQPESTMPEQPTDQTSKLASLRKALLAALTLPESHRVHAAQLAATDPDAAETFLGKGVADREADVKAALDADPIVFRGELTGAEVRRSEGPRMLELAKSAEESRATIKRHEEALAASSAQRETAEVASFCKGKLASLPGSDDVQQHIVGLLRAAGGPLLEPSLQALAAASANIAKQSKAPGATTEDADPDPTPVDALAAWNKAVEAYATKHSISDRRAATAAFLSTSEGRAAKATYDASRAYGQKPGGR